MASPDPPHPAVFLDRDGTLMEEVHYCNDPARVRVFPGAGEALARLRLAGFRNVVITNQSGIGRGIITPGQYAAVHDELLRQLGAENVYATYFCPDLPGGDSPRRKPRPGMVLEAAAEHGLDLARSWFVGDKPADIQCGRNAGTRTILVRTGYGRESSGLSPDHTAEDVVEAAALILSTPPVAPDSDLA